MAYTGAVAESLRNAVAAMKGLYTAQANGQGYNSAQIDYIAKTFGIGTGFQPYDLSAAAYYLVPVFSPIRNRLPRLHLQGSNMEFKSVISPDTGNTSPLLAEGGAPNALVTQTADVITNFKTYGRRSDPVTFQQLFAGAGKAGDFNVDSRAVAATLLLERFFIDEERLMLGGVGSQTQIVSSTTAPNNGFDFTIGGAIGNAPAGGSAVANTTGGSIPASTPVDIQYCAVSTWAMVTGMPAISGSISYGTTTQGQSLPQADDLTVTTASTGSTNSVTVTVPDQTKTGHAILGWAIYAGTAGQAGAHYYAAFTTGAPVTLTSVPTSGQQPPATDQSIGTVTGGTGSSVEGAFNGILPWLFGFNGAANPAGTLVNAAGHPTLSTYQDAFVTAFQTGFADPDLFLMNAGDLKYLTDVLIGNGGGQPYWFAANQGNAQGNMTAGFRVARFLNPVTSRELPVDVHAYLPQGTATALTMQLPAWYVGNNVPDTWIWGGSMDYLEIDYQPTPDYVKYATDIMCQGAIHCFLPNQNIVWTGLQN